MAIYTSRFSNPELKNGKYTAFRISVGSPRWDTGYRIDGEIKDLMPFGLLGKYDNDKEGFRLRYFAKLDTIGIYRLKQLLQAFASAGKDVVLLCYEDVRKGDDNWCHRVMFAEWWKERTGEEIKELADPTPEPKVKPQTVKDEETGGILQLSLF